jgi:hypothetical protein
MSAKEKKYLLDKLTETHLATRAILENVDLEMPVYKDTGWRVRDIVGHIATWDQEVTKSLQAYHAGSEYIIPGMDGDETDYNEKAVLDRQKLSTQQILNEFEHAHNELKKAVEEMPTERFPGDLVYPWGNERGTITRLVEYMIEHAIEHQGEIKNAMQESQGG